ncbi:MAG: translation elongation factor Ts [Bernardetiaceae bacterium]
MAITAKDVNKLRQMTGAGMMDCKKALVEAEGDFEAAIDILRKRGQKLSAKRADKEAAEGSVFVETFADDQQGILIALNCETDFVAKNDDFVRLGNTILAQAVAHQPATKEDLLAIEVEGRKIEDHLTELVGKIGEKIELSAYEHLTAERVVSYVHAGAKLGVLVALTNVGEADYPTIGRNIGMQIAAMNPIAVDETGVDAATQARELEIARDKAKQEGKPEQMLDKIAQGALKKYFKENTLLSQAFVKEPKSSVQDYLNQANKGMTVTTFKRVALG